MRKIKNIDMLNGNLFSSIIRFSIPLLFVGLIQNLFSAVDIMVLGFMADTNAVAAVGATSTLIHLLVNIALGISSGSKIVLSRLMGEGEEEKTRETVYTSMMTALGLGILLTVLGVSLSPLFLRIVKCPAEIFDDALAYLRIYFLSSPAIMLYNFGSNVIQVDGDSQRPLYYMIVSGLLNVALNFVLCMIMSEKVAAVAIATAASQVLGAALVMARLLRMDGPCRFRIRGGRWNTKLFCKLISNGLPIGLSHSLYSIANLQIQSNINVLGPAAIAGNSAMTSIDNIEASIVSTPWSASAGVFVGKNVGANNRKRVKLSVLYCLSITTVLSIVLSALCVTFSRPLVFLFVDDEQALMYAQIRMLYTTLPYAIAAANGVLSNTIQAFGYSMLSTANSIVSVLLFRVFWMQVIFPQNPTFHMLMLCFLVSWCLVLTVNIISFIYLYFFRFAKGKIKKIG